MTEITIDRLKAALTVAANPDNGYVILIDPEESYSSVVKYLPLSGYLSGYGTTIDINTVRDVKAHNGHYMFTTTSGNTHHLYIVTSVDPTDC